MKAGKYVSEDLSISGAHGMSADAAINQFIAEAESTVNILTGINYSDSFSTLNTDKRAILSEVVSNLAAIECVKYDPSSYPSRIIAEDTIVVLRDAALRGLSLLRDKNQTDFLDAT